MKDLPSKTVDEGAVPRYESLDCLRGIAASIVLFDHTLGYMTGPSAWIRLVDGKLWIAPILDKYPTRVIGSARQAVILFFVLSGFALYLLFESNQRKLFNRAVVPVFLVSRWLRLYPVYIFSICTAIATYSLLYGLDLSYPEIPWLPSGKIDAWNILGHLTLLGIFDSQRFNGPIWTIVYEMRISILFPLIYLIITRLRTRSIIIAVSIPLVASAVMTTTMSENVYLTNLILTIHYASFFILGALVAHSRVSLIRWGKGLRTPNVGAILILGLTLYTDGHFPLLPFHVTLLIDLMAGIGSAMIITVSLSFPVLERSAALKQIGKMSFSLYLMHTPCLVAVYVVFADTVPFPLLCAMMIMISLMVSRLTWALVESRSLQWSRRVRRPRQGSIVGANVA
jgi:peptidoglycan/LPS O-acetylase OafA/YrhL